ncbi:MAG: hypothetical protein IT381_28780, partial [Deltaproteobacteria bacterium]|nr:hypothetical protein [Deltaproteobacteria bacterium]
MNAPRTISPSKIADFLACRHLTALERARAEGAIKRPYFDDPSAKILAKLGDEHEERFLASLKAEKKGEIVEIDKELPWPEAAEATTAAMKSGASVIYQATFFQPPYLGRADFLVRVNKKSKLGEWSYEAV